MKAMLASVIQGPRDVALKEVPMPEPAEGEILLRMESAAVCGSDLGVYAHGAVARPGRELVPGCSGHEFLGRVIASRSTEFQEGQRVLAMPPLGNGWAEYLTIPDRCSIPAPEDLEAEIALQAQQLGTILHALRPVGSLIDKSVAIVGLGPAGRHFLGQVLGMGARTVVGFERRAARRTAAEHLGLDAVVDAEDLAAVQDATAHMAPGPDLVIDAAGGQEAIDLTYQLARPQGAILRFGLPHGATTLDHNIVLRKEVVAYHAVGAQAEPRMACFRLAMRMIERGQVDVAPLISHSLPLGRLPEALELADNRHGNAIKVMIKPL